MRLIQEAGTYFLEQDGRRVALSPADVRLLRQMTPMGRKVALRKRAVERMASNPADLEAREILGLFQLPAREWAFPIPDAP